MIVSRRPIMSGATLLLLSLFPTTSARAEPVGSLCIDRQLESCVAAIKMQFHIDQKELAHSLAENERRDVNGRPISAGRSVTFSAWSSSKSDLFIVQLELSSDNKVTKADIPVDGLVDHAKTEDLYDLSGLLPAMLAVFSPSCWNNSKTDLYRWFENSVKPKLRHNPLERSVTADGAKETYFNVSDATEFCGTNISYIHRFGNDTNYINEGNPHGIFSSASLHIESLGFPQLPVATSDNANLAPSHLATAEPSVQSAATRGGLGIGYVPSPVGAVILLVVPGSKAAVAGLKPGETIEAVNGISTKGMDAATVTAIIHAASPTLTLKVVGVGDVIIKQ